MKYRLKDNHTTLIKLRKVEDFMSKLGVEIQYDGYGRFSFIDKGESYEIKDIEGEDISSFPHLFETKLTYDKE